MALKYGSLPRDAGDLAGLVYNNTYYGVTRGWLPQRAGSPSLNGGGAATAVSTAVKQYQLFSHLSPLSSAKILDIQPSTWTIPSQQVHGMIESTVLPPSE